MTVGGAEGLDLLLMIYSIKRKRYPVLNQMFLIREEVHPNAFVPCIYSTYSFNSGWRHLVGFVFKTC